MAKKANAPKSYLSSRNSLSSRSISSHAGQSCLVERAFLKSSPQSGHQSCPHDKHLATQTSSISPQETLKPLGWWLIGLSEASYTAIPTRVHPCGSSGVWAASGSDEAMWRSCSVYSFNLQYTRGIQRENKLKLLFVAILRCGRPYLR